MDLLLVEGSYQADGQEPEGHYAYSDYRTPADADILDGTRPAGSEASSMRRQIW
jgi:hypothetical protein